MPDDAATRSLAGSTGGLRARGREQRSVFGGSCCVVALQRSCSAAPLLCHRRRRPALTFGKLHDSQRAGPVCVS